MAFTKIPTPTTRTIDFTSSGTFVVPSGVYSAEFLVVGAGGGGGGADNSVNTRAAAGGGGGGGAVKLVTLPLTPNQSYTITIGAKGTGGAIGAAGNNGGATEVVLSGTTLIKCAGGQGAQGVTNTNAGIDPAAMAFSAAGGGVSQSASTAVVTAGGGGSSADYYRTSARYAAGPFESIEGSGGGAVGSAQTNLGKLGLYGYGNGGGGGLCNTTAIPVYSGQAAFGGGIGGTAGSVVTAQDINGGNATIAGCGGGGALSALSTTGASGGNGADGLVRITYFGQIRDY